MAPRRKRNASPSEGPSRQSKRTRKEVLTDPEEPDVIVIDDSSEVDFYADPNVEDEDLDSILAQIKALEQSELSAQVPQLYYVPSSSNAQQPVIDLEDDSALEQLYSRSPVDEDDVEILSDVQVLSSKSNDSGKIQLKGIPKRSSTPIRPQNEDLEQTFTQPLRPDDALETFRDLFIGSRECSKCGANVPSPRGLVNSSDVIFHPSLLGLLHAACLSCRTVYCRGCFKPLTCRRGCKGSTKTLECTVINCCAEIRAIAIFEALGGFDRSLIAQRLAGQTRIEKKNPKSTVKSVGPGGTGYGIAGSSRGSKGKAATSTKAEIAWGVSIRRALLTLTELLPAPYNDSAQIFDMLPHPSIGSLITLSHIPAVLADLLRNDSVTDWISRKELYTAMLSLLRRMSDCELTAECLIRQRYQTSSVYGLEGWMWQEEDIAWAKNDNGEDELDPPLHYYFKKLTKHSEAFLAGALQALGQGGEDEEALILGTSLCGDIVAARDDLERTIGILGLPLQEIPVTHSKSSRKGKSKEHPSASVDQLYANACERLAFRYISLATTDFTYASFNYNNLLIETQNSTRIPKNRFHLVKELAVTATSLPAGIWVRVDDVRNDAIKVMIAGPDGTPYAGGLFEFDCFLPLEYPTVPPMMNLQTTGGGTVRFNPNLYNCGKVCLSLLGTWPGRPEEQWSPSKSTLLQVFVSLQSMILIDTPYFNEPGHGQANPDLPASIEYNENIMRQTTKWAILDWLLDKNRNSIWKDVIVSHFTIFQDKIRQKIIDADQTIVTTKKGKGRAQPRIDSHNLKLFEEGLNRIKTWQLDDNTD